MEVKIIKGNEFVFDAKHTENKSFGESKTIPGESYSISEILEKFTKGIQLQVQQDSFDSPFSIEDFDAPDMEKINSMDLVEIEALRDNVGLQIKEYEDEIKKGKKILEEAKKASKIQLEKKATEEDEETVDQKKDTDNNPDKNPE